MGYGNWLHGKAVAAGTVMAADLSQRLGWISATGVARIRGLFERAGLPVVAPDLGADKYLQLMGLDKKVEGGKMRFVLLKYVGNAVITGDVPPAICEQTLEACSAWLNLPLMPSARNSRGRKSPEAAPPGRSEFQRDRDRIIHSGAFAASNTKRRCS